MGLLSPYLLAIITAWIMAQGSKLLIGSIRRQEVFDLRKMYVSGDMPSSHSATAVALATVIGLNDGVDTAVFGVAVLFAGLVMYDAVMVRRSSGEQGAAIHALIKEHKSMIQLPRTAKGHEPLEVAFGALIGLAVGLFVFFLSR